MLTGFIYKIINTINNKVYIGQTRKTIPYRFKSHIRSAYKETSLAYNTKLSRAIRKYGKNVFIVESLKEIHSFKKLVLCARLDAFEKFYINEYNSTNSDFGYNVQKGGHISSKDALLKLEEKLFCFHIEYEGQSYKTANEIIIKTEYAEIILYNLENTELARSIIDKEDIPKIINFRWGLMRPDRGQYVYSSNNNIRLENLIVKCPKNFVTVHINKNSLDNRKCNLKVVSQTEKQQNTNLPKNNISGHKGVWFCKDRNKWLAQITINNKQKSLGRYNTFEEAVAAREAAEKVYYNKW